MLFKKTHKVKNVINSLIGANTTVMGDITFSGGLRVDGVVRGNIKELRDTPSALILGEHGCIEGHVEVSTVVINGKISGQVSAALFVELQSKSHVIGDITYHAIEIDVGASVEGRLVHLNTVTQAKLPYDHDVEKDIKRPLQK